MPHIYSSALSWKVAWRMQHGFAMGPKRHLPLRFIIGAGRSGTTWAGRVLGMAEQPLRYLQEPLTYARPFFGFSKENDRLALPWAPQPGAKHPMTTLCREMSRIDADYGKMLGHYSSKKVIRNDPDAELVLLKEVHSTLATLGLTKALAAKTVVITRNPIFVVDSLFDYQDIKVSIWRNEYSEVCKESFLSDVYGTGYEKVLDALRKHPDDGVNRQNTITAKTLTVALISKALKHSAEHCDAIMHVSYEAMCDTPAKLLKEMAEHLDIDLGEKGMNFIAETTSARDGDNHPTQTVHKNTTKQIDRDLKSLSSKEMTYLTNLLASLGLHGPM